MRWALWPTCALVLTLGGTLWGHDSRPLYVELNETTDGRLSVKWKAPSSMPAFNVPDIVLPENCVALGDAVGGIEPGAYVRRRLYQCGEGGLAGQTIQVRYPVLNPSLTTLFRLQTATGQTHTKLLSPKEVEWVVPAVPTRSGVAWEYAELGTRHILEGFDHLLFVFGLFLLVRDRWMLLKTITSFTVAHSITLALATLGYASAPIAPLEAAIALSIFFLGPEIIRYRRGETSLTIQHPWVVAFAFGLLHGFGFASGLANIGLPQGEIPVALLFFNVGVELGQIGCVAVALALAASLRRLDIRWPQWVEAMPGYVVGSLGAFWMIERTVAMFTGS